MTMQQALYSGNLGRVDIWSMILLFWMTPKDPMMAKTAVLLSIRRPFKTVNTLVETGVSKWQKDRLGMQQQPRQHYLHCGRQILHETRFHLAQLHSLVQNGQPLLSVLLNLISPVIKLPEHRQPIVARLRPVLSIHRRITAYAMSPSLLKKVPNLVI
jgi:hypothetical protein